MSSTFVVCDWLTEAHRLTERELAELAQLLKDYAQGQAAARLTLLAEIKARYQQISDSLYEHFVLEELALFSLLSSYRTMMLMTVEHDDLLALQKQFETALLAEEKKQKADLVSLWEAFSAFEARLKAHILEEERGIFPLAVQSLEPEEQLKSQRLYGEVLALFEANQEPPLPRAQPTISAPVELLSRQTPESPLKYQTLYEREHASVKQIALQSGAKQALHWVGPHQCVVVQQGSVVLTSKTGEQQLNAGAFVTIDSQCWFAFQALEDAVLLIFSVWPHPHYTKAN